MHRTRQLVMTYVLVRFFVFAHGLKILHEAVFDDRILLLCPPFGDLRQPFVPEVLFQVLGLALVRGEERHQIFDAPLLQRCRQVLHRLLSKESSEHNGDSGNGYICTTDR